MKKYMGRDSFMDALFFIYEIIKIKNISLQWIYKFIFEKIDGDYQTVII